MDWTPGIGGKAITPILTALGIILVLYPITIAFYNIYLHPLSRYPGPKLWVAFRLTSVRSLLMGNLVHDTQKIHQGYGVIVRIAPDEISVAHPDGWEDIYASRPGHKPFPKNPIWWGGKSMGRPESLINAEDPADHMRMRKLLDHSFTMKALEKQEPIVQSYVDLLVEKLSNLAASDNSGQDGIVDIVQWFNFTTFDIVGDLGFGEPFGCLRDSTYHPWVATIFSHFKSRVFRAAIRFYPWLGTIVTMCTPSTTMKVAMDNYRLAIEKIHRRLNLETERPDFMSPVLKYNDEKGMTISEIEGTFNIVIVAGSETTAKVLSGITNYLTQNRTTLEALVSEVRSAFKDEKDITFDATKSLAYLNAVIKEGLRMCPPTPAGLPRVVPAGGDNVLDQWFPGGTHISLHQWTTYRFPSNFHHPNSFVPESWLHSATTNPSSPYHTDQRHAVQNFSLGPRNCIGKNLAWAEMRLVLARLIWNFDISAADALDWTRQKTWVLVQKEPFKVKLTDVRRLERSVA